MLKEPLAYKVVTRMQHVVTDHVVCSRHCPSWEYSNAYNSLCSRKASFVAGREKDNKDIDE